MNNVMYEPFENEIMELDDNKTKYFYNQEFKTKLFIIHPLLKEAYSKIRNLIKKYRVKRKVGKTAEEFYYNDIKLIRLTCFDRSLRLYLNLNQTDELIDYSKFDGYQDVKYLFIINNEESTLKALELIEKVLKEHNVPEQLKYKEYDFVSDISLKSSWQLALTKQAGIILDSASIDDINLLTDKEAKNCIVYEQSLKPIDNSHVSTITVGELSAAFSESYCIDIDLLKKVGLVDSTSTFLKVCNGGKCYHKINIIANDYDIECLKMIVLTGGNAVKLI